MKTRTLFIVMAFLFIGTTTQAQFFKKLGKSAEKAAERAVTRKTEQKVSKETEKAMDTILGNGKKKKKASKQNKEGVGNKEEKRNEPNSQDSAEENVKENNANQKAWSKYNFVPGDKIIFHDDLVNEESGEFPSRWDLLNGNAENASLGEENVINMMHGSKITPLMEEDTYLPGVFTIEFDALFKRTHGATYQRFLINLWSGSKNYGYSEDGQSYCGSIALNMHGASLTCNDNGNAKEYSSFDESMIAGVDEPVWRHIAIAFSKRSLKVFIDEKRVLNIPNLDYKPEAFAIEAYGPYKELSAIKNIRIAEGGKKLYDRVMADGKFVTRGILFDVNKATLKPSSMGVINEVANMMQEHPDLKFRIEGHTDSDGEDTFNLQLSEQRAAAVKEALMNSGIDTTKLTIKGMGESVPVSDNASPEGKANNRRVEFVKI